MTIHDPCDPPTSCPEAKINRSIARILAKLDKLERRDALALEEVASGGIFADHVNGVFHRFYGPRDGHPRQTHGRVLRYLYDRGFIRLGREFGWHRTQIVLSDNGRVHLNLLIRAAGKLK